MTSTDIYNAVKVNEDLLTAGQPTAAEFRALAAEGFTAVLNLAAPPSRDLPLDESDLVRSLGMAYEHIPVDWGNPTEEDFEAFEDVMADLPRGKTLIHCAANFRVTAFYALYAMKHHGWSEERAEQFRAAIWQGSNFPIWEQFIAGMKRKIAAADR